MREYVKGIFPATQNQRFGTIRLRCSRIWKRVKKWPKNRRDLRRLINLDSKPVHAAKLKQRTVLQIMIGVQSKKSIPSVV